ncbi:MAG: 2-oxoacid:acceptor oxidoreductase family protein [Bacteroidales bacterium]|nr:2-oxoacid:acceptor oxidoreductase family protein [Bacteroidales bacterium]
METKVLNTNNLPFCKGCGHHGISQNTAKAIENMGLNILDVIFVTDIGCHGIIDKSLNAHTVHGLHGRSVALGAGVSMGLPENKKVIVFIGDGGATIGLQHILEAARLNVNLTVIIHNNFLYGMTGGQLSGLTPKGFNTVITPNGSPFGEHDICELVYTAGANYVSRVIGIGDFSETIQKALETPGFSLIEVMEICPSYGVKFNPKRKLQEIVEAANKPIKTWTNNRAPFSFPERKTVNNLFDKTPVIEKLNVEKNLTKQIQVVLSGSAGEGVQLAATILCKAAVKHGYNITQKGTYPVTVGVGFSVAEINISPNEIYFHGLSNPEYMIITSQDGYEYSKKTIQTLNKDALLFIDQSLPTPDTNAHIITMDFRGKGAKNAVLSALFSFAKKTNIISTETLKSILSEMNMLEKFPLAEIEKELA